MRDTGMADCYVIVPFKDGFGVLAECLDSLAAEMPAGTEAVLVDDGSDPEAGNHPLLKPYLDDGRFHLLRHEVNRGPAQARNTGLGWCRDKGAEIIVFLDSDCLARPGCIEAHRRLHRAHPDFACIGGAIHGRGRGVWAKLDALMSWFSSIPETPAGIVREPYHLPSTNMSLKAGRLRAGDAFNARLRTGEDVAFVKSLRARGETVFFSPEPEITHRDRETMVGFLRHQHRWGLHTYVVRFGEKSLAPWRRALFVLVFIPALPVYVALTTWLNVAPWLKRSYAYVLSAPVLALFYVLKGVSVIIGAVLPGQALYPKTPSAS